MERTQRLENLPLNTIDVSLADVVCSLPGWAMIQESEYMTDSRVNSQFVSTRRPTRGWRES